MNPFISPIRPSGSPLRIRCGGGSWLRSAANLVQDTQNSPKRTTPFRLSRSGPRGFPAGFVPVEAAAAMVNDRGEWPDDRRPARSSRRRLPPAPGEIAERRRASPRGSNGPCADNAARLLVREDRALGAQAHALVPAASGGSRHSGAPDRGGDRKGVVVRSRRARGASARRLPDDPSCGRGDGGVGGGSRSGGALPCREAFYASPSRRRTSSFVFAEMSIRSSPMDVRDGRSAPY